MKTQVHEGKGKSVLAITGAVLAGLGASACCTIPLAAILLGLGGGWLSTLKVLEPFRLIFILVAATFLGYAFWKAYRKPKPNADARCEKDSACAVVTPARRRFNLVMLWVGALFTILMIVSPYLIVLFAK